MGEVVAVHVVQTTDHLFREVSDGLLVEMLRVDDGVEELAAFADLEAQVVRLAVLVYVVQSADVRMVQCFLELDLGDL